MILKRLLIASVLIASISTFVSAMTCTTLTKSLTRGSTDSEVTILQQFLFDGGYLKTQPNGIFGAGTVTAVKRFQIANGVSPVGSVGKMTRAKVKEVSCGNFGKVSNNKILEFGKEYDNVTYGNEINGSLVFVAQSCGKSFIVYKGKEIGKEYDSSINPTGIGDKLAYNAIKNKKKFIVYDDKEIGKEYDSIDYPYQVGTKLAYIAIKDSKSFIVYDGKEIGKNYDSVDSMKDINGELAYRAKKNGKWIIVFKGKEFGQEYDSVSFPLGTSKSESKLSYIGKKDNFSHTIYDGQVIGKEYIYSDKVSIFNEKIIYLAANENKSFIVLDGKEIGKEYDVVMYPTVLGKKIAYQVTKNQKNFIVYDGKELGKEYTGALIPENINGKLAYNVTDSSSLLLMDSKKSFIVYDGKEYGKSYESAKYPFEVGGNLAYFVKEKNKQYIVLENLLGKSIEIAGSSKVVTCKNLDIMAPVGNSTNKAEVSKSDSYNLIGLEQEPYVDKKEKFSIHLPKDWIVTDSLSEKDKIEKGVIFNANAGYDTKGVYLMIIFKRPTMLDEKSVLSVPVTSFSGIDSSIKVLEDSTVVVNGRKIRVISGDANLGDVTMGVTYLIFIKNNQEYYVTSFIRDAPGSSYKDKIIASLKTFTLD